MPVAFENIRVSVAVLQSGKSAYPANVLLDTLTSVLGQDHPNLELLLVDDRGPNAAMPDLPAATRPGTAIRHLPGTYANRAAAYNAAIHAAEGEHLLVLFNQPSAIVLRNSCVRTMLMAARRNGLHTVYADYELQAADGSVHDRHLLDWHPGRLRDLADFGEVVLYPLAMLREIGGFNEQFNAADRYDAWLHMSEHCSPVHIGNRYAGSLYTVTAPSREHNVFDYLLADKASQLEMERALSAHLERTGALLAPGTHQRPLSYTPQQEDAFKACLASVIIPVNNRPQFIGRAIESVQAQTVPQVEVIVVVNGGDDDPTVGAVQRYLPGGDLHAAGKPPVHLVVVDINNLGLCLNTGLAQARGKFYVQLDSDDRLKPDAVERLLAVFDSDPRVGMVIGSYEVSVLDETTGEIKRDERVPVVTHDEWTEDNGRNNLLRIGGAGAPRCAHIKAIAEVGWFGVNDDPHCRNYAEDYDLVLRMSENFRIGRVWDPIYEVIRHSGGTDHNIDQATIDRNDNAKDHMRWTALKRRKRLNGAG